MAVTHTLQAAFSQSIGKALVIPPGAKTMVFWGTGGDGIETNRIVGGNALAVTSGTPVHAANYVSVGHQPAAAPTRNDVIDFANANDATSFAAGRTFACVARVTPFGAENTGFIVCMSNMTAARPARA